MIHVYGNHACNINTVIPYCVNDAYSAKTVTNVLVKLLNFVFISHKGVFSVL